MPVVYWMGAESCLGIICACAATIRPLFGTKKSNTAHYSGYSRHTGSMNNRGTNSAPESAATLSSDKAALQQPDQFGTFAEARSPSMDSSLELGVPLGSIMVRKDVDLDASERH